MVIENEYTAWSVGWYCLNKFKGAGYRVCDGGQAMNTFIK